MSRRAALAAVVLALVACDRLLPVGARVDARGDRRETPLPDRAPGEQRDGGRTDRLPDRRVDGVLVTKKDARYDGAKRDAVTIDARKIDTGKDSCVPQCAGRCQGASNGCGETCLNTTCAGCCDAAKQCQSGNTSAACGVGGVPCKNCPVEMPPNGVCNLGTHSCMAATLLCDASSCSTGCCLGTSCLPGNTATACGTKGGPCQNCAALLPNGFCDVFTRQCISIGPACGSCTGCCSAKGCEPGISPTACGRDGGPCADCGPFACTNYACEG